LAGNETVDFLDRRETAEASRQKVARHERFDAAIALGRLDPRAAQEAGTAAPSTAAPSVPLRRGVLAARGDRAYEDTGCFEDVTARPLDLRSHCKSSDRCGSY
jgi:hypothetical protein